MHHQERPLLVDWIRFLEFVFLDGQGKFAVFVVNVVVHFIVFVLIFVLSNEIGLLDLVGLVLVLFLEPLAFVAFSFLIFKRPVAQGHRRIIPVDAKYFAPAVLHIGLKLLLQLKEALGCDFTVTTSLMLAVIISRHVQLVSQSLQGAPEKAITNVGNDLDIVKVWKDQMQILHELAFLRRQLLTRENSQQIGEVVISVEAIPMDVSVQNKATSQEVFSKHVVVYAVGYELVKVNS